MGGNPTQTTQQQSQSAPWSPAVPYLTNLLSGIGGLNTGVTSGQNSALANLQSGAAGIPNFGGQGTNTVNSLFSGGGANNEAGLVQGAYGNLTNSLSPLTNPNNLNPYNTPGFSTALSTMNNDITNNVNDQFAAAGRDLSPGNSTALARGLSQGEGSLIQGQYNANVGNLENASNALYGAGVTTGNTLTGYNQLGNTNQLSALYGAGAIPGLSMAPGQAQLSAANAGYNMPFANMGTQESLLTPIAALGGQSNGTSTSQTQVPAWQQGLGGAMGGAGIFGSLFGAPAGGTSAWSGLMSSLPFL